MKSQGELYQALQEIDTALSHNVVLNLLDTLDGNLSVIADTAKAVMRCEDFTDSAFEIITQYSALCEEILADVQVATFGIKNRVAKALEEEDKTE
jgi:hypothetical protein